MGAPSRLLRDRLSGRQAFFSALTDVSKERFVPVPGGVLGLDDESYILCGVEVSGDTSERDELCAIRGIEFEELVSQHAEPDPDWKGPIL